MNKLKADLEQFKLYCRRHLRSQLSLYDEIGDLSIQFMADDLDHAIDHIIVDHCKDEDEA